MVIEKAEDGPKELGSGHTTFPILQSPEVLIRCSAWQKVQEILLSPSSGSTL